MSDVQALLGQMKSLNEALVRKWSPVLDAEGLAPVRGFTKRAALAKMLENQKRWGTALDRHEMLMEAPTNVSGAFPSATNLKGYDPVLISLVRRALPQTIAFDILGVQPMNGPTGLIFALRAKYGTMGGTEALFDEADTDFSGTGTHAGSDPVNGSFTTGTGMSTTDGEALGDGNGTNFGKMAIAIDKVTATAKTRGLATEWSVEIQQDLQAIHGLDAEGELSQVLQTEIIQEINREAVRTVYSNAKVGAQQPDIGTPGTFNFDTDSNGRWFEEKVKGFMYQIDREANQIAKETRRGRGNIILTTSDVASALSLVGRLDSSELKDNLSHDGDTQNTFVGILNDRYRVYVDPYVPVSTSNFLVVGYKGQISWDAGLFYCPYVPLQLYRAFSTDSFQPSMAYRTRYAMVSNPFANSAGDGSLSADSNVYYRKVKVTNIM